MQVYLWDTKVLFKITSQSMMFFILNLIHYLRSYIKGCHTCQLAHSKKTPTRQLQTRIHPNYLPLSTLSMDLNVMPKSCRGQKFIFCIIDEVTNYLITKSEEIGDAIIEHVITKNCIPEYVIVDKYSALMSSLMKYLFQEFDIKTKTVVPYNHQSLQAKNGIKSLSCILTKHLTNLGQMWP